MLTENEKNGIIASKFHPDHKSASVLRYKGFQAYPIGGVVFLDSHLSRTQESPLPFALENMSWIGFWPETLTDPG